MADIAKYIRIFNTSPDDDYVKKRIASINSIEAMIKKKVTSKDIFEFSNALFEALEDSSKSNVVINSIAVPALKKNSSSFVADEESLQILTCTTLATIQYLEKNKNYSQKQSNEFLLAAALWSGLSFQRPISNQEKLESLRKELLNVISTMVVSITENSRQRINIISYDHFNSTDKTSEIADLNYNKIIDDLNFNSKLDREELDILWYVLGNWSQISNSQISHLNSVQSCIVSSVEIGKLLKRFPAKSHCNLACRNGNCKDQFSGSKLLEELGPYTSIISNELGSYNIEGYGNIFPVINFLLKRDIVPIIETGYTLEEWSSRLLIEISLVNFDKLN